MFLGKIFKNDKGEYVSILEVLFGKNNLENYIYTMAEAHAIDLIASIIAKTEIQTFEMKKNKIEENRGDLYWTLNIQPNFNENGTSFLYKLVCKLLVDGSALVLINGSNNEYLYIADEFNISDRVLKEKVFTDITISDAEGNSINTTKKYTTDNTIYFSLKNNLLKQASESFKTNSGKILKTAQSSFIKTNTGKWKLKKPGGQPTLIDAETNKPIELKEYTEKITKGLFEEDDAVVLLSEMFDLINLNLNNQKNITDFESIFLRTSKTVAQKWKIPLDVFFGDFTDKSNGLNNFITFGVDLYYELIEDGFNISLVGKQSYLKGEYVKFNRSTIAHKDVLDCGTSIDKLTANKFSRNEINKFLRLPYIDEDWANEHALTKNYENVKGGANSEE